MRPSVELHDALARLVEYPREGYDATLAESAAVVAAGCPQAGALLEPFLTFCGSRPLGELEELFARTFDNTEERALEVGWHVFGENYTRGTFMVTVRGLLREYGVEESGELPDHLSHVLALLGRHDPDKAAVLVEHTVAPAVRKVFAALEGSSNPWAPVLAAVLAVLELHAPGCATGELPPLHRAREEC